MNPRVLRATALVAAALALSACGGDFRPGTSEHIAVDPKDCGTYKLTGLAPGEGAVGDIRWKDDGSITVTTSADVYKGRGVTMVSDGYKLNADLRSVTSGRKVHIDGLLRCR
jgi:hypothetical protein